jgi:2-dehydropantoate 2-reductase
MKILALGAGGIGGYFGGRLVQAGADVTFLVRPRRATQLAKDGLIIKSPHGDVRQPVATVTTERLAPGYDLILLACKAYDLDAATASIAPAVGSHTAILPTLNGLRHVETLQERFGATRVLGGLAQIAVTLTPDGEIRHLSDFHLLAFGERSGGPSPRCEAFSEICAEANFTSRLSENINLELWEKFVFLATLAGVTCLMRASIGAIMRADDGETLVREMLEECRKVAAAAGHPPRADVLSRYAKLLTERDSALTASMLRDMERGGATEGEHIIGDMVRRGRKLGVVTPLLRAALVNLQAYERARPAAA